MAEGHLDPATTALVLIEFQVRGEHGQDSSPGLAAANFLAVQGTASRGGARRAAPLHPLMVPPARPTPNRRTSLRPRAASCTRQ
jgi:hypothetical protein